MTQLFQHGKIDNQIADGNSHAGVAAFRLENAKGKIFNGKMRIDWNVDETTQWRTHQLDLTTKHTKATKKIQNHLQRNFVLFVSFVVIKESGAHSVPRSGRRNYNCRTTRRSFCDIRLARST